MLLITPHGLGFVSRGRKKLHFVFFVVAGVTHLCQTKKITTNSYKNVILVFSEPKHKFLFFMRCPIFNLVTLNGNVAFLIQILPRTRRSLIEKSLPNNKKSRISPMFCAIITYLCKKTAHLKNISGRKSSYFLTNSCKVCQFSAK